MNVTNANPFQISIIDGVAHNSFVPRSTIFQAKGDFLKLDYPTKIINSEIEEIQCSENLILLNCKVGKVFAKNLFLDKTSFKEATAKESAWIFFSLPPDGALNFNVGKFTIGKDVNFYYPVKIERFHFFGATMHGNFTLPLGAKSVILEDMVIKGDVIFADEDPSVERQAILKGKSVLGGKVVNGVLADER